MVRILWILWKLKHTRRHLKKWSLIVGNLRVEFHCVWEETLVCLACVTTKPKESNFHLGKHCILTSISPLTQYEIRHEINRFVILWQSNIQKRNPFFPSPLKHKKRGRDLVKLAVKWEFKLWFLAEIYICAVLASEHENHTSIFTNFIDISYFTRRHDKWPLGSQFAVFTPTTIMAK